MLTSEIDVRALAGHYSAVRRRLMGGDKSNVVPFPTKKTHQRPSSVKSGAILSIPPIKVVYMFQPLPFNPSVTVEPVPSTPRPITVDLIQRIVCAHYGITRIDIISDRRSRDITWPRQVAMYLVKSITPRSLPDIGKRFGGKDHTTVMHAVRKVTERATTDQCLATTLSILEHKIRNGEAA